MGFDEIYSQKLGPGGHSVVNHQDTPNVIADVINGCDTIFFIDHGVKEADSDKYTLTNWGTLGFKKEGVGAVLYKTSLKNDLEMWKKVVPLLKDREITVWTDQIWIEGIGVRDTDETKEVRVKSVKEFMRLIIQKHYKEPIGYNSPKCQDFIEKYKNGKPLTKTAAKQLLNTQFPNALEYHLFMEEMEKIINNLQTREEQTKKRINA
ncbi:hypothetical protein KO465_01255 [Candidatus Micrarchaeota archaeon]|jgi:hypothetical protein|nr:hypothetical protein [Candidatus Micrarchaeota archaeon]